MSDWRDDAPAATMVDLAFALSGSSVPRDYAQPLLAALQRELPWLVQEAQAGIHPLRLVHGSAAGPMGLLSPRTRLLLRLPRARVEAAQAAVGQQLDVGGHRVGLGALQTRELLPHGTLYAHAVAAQGEDEAQFMQLMTAQLEALAVRSQVVCGKRHARPLDAGTVTTFSLMLHGLNPVESLRVLEHGLGAYRLLGCGIFVPHKSAAAVGE